MSKRRRGAVSVSVILILLTIFLAATLTIKLGLREAAIGAELEKGVQARYLAEAGVLYACLLVETRRSGQKLPAILKKNDLLETQDELSIEIREDSGLRKDGKEIALKGHHLFKATAAVKGAVRVVEAEVEEKREPVSKVVIVMRREY